MGKLSIVALLALFLAIVTNTSVLAQNKSQRTGSARAAYGEPVYSYTTKKKAKRQGKKKRRKSSRKQPATINQNRTKSPWVN